MGGKASKLAKPLPNTISRTPVGSILPTARFVPTTEPTSTPKEESTKIPSTQSDVQNPNYMQNLNSLGAVWVAPKPTLLRSNNRMLDILKKRAASEEAAELPTPNRISAQTLSNLLDDRKSAKSRKDVENLIKEYGLDLDIELLEELATHINAPSVSSVKSLQDETLETQTARWADPKFTETQTIESK